MIGFHFLKAGPTQFVIHYQDGKVRRAGAGLSFVYYNPSSSIVVVPIGSADAPFIFSEATSDFQAVTVQGQLMYRVTDPERVASLLDFTVDGGPERHQSDDPEKLPQRLVTLAQVLIRAEIGRLPLREALRASDDLARALQAGLAHSETPAALGVEVLDVSITAIRPSPEMARALEADARELLLQQADLAIYDRRNAAVEQERRIQENELNTQLAVEAKERQIREAKVEADLAVEAKEQEIREAHMAGQIRLEKTRKSLVQAQVENARAEAESQAQTMEAALRPLLNLDEATLQLLSVQTVDPRLMVSMALREIARNAAKIGHLNITPDLMESLLVRPEEY
jgi:regulator of protease activity HflC (stomatin/prohibitin superfamily)